MNPNGTPENLRPPWQPGESGNPKGRKAAGAYMSEWFNSLAEHTEAELLAVVADAGTPYLKRACAQHMLDAMKKLKPFEAIANRTAGKPRQTIELGGSLELVKFGLAVPPMKDEKPA